MITQAYIMGSLGKATFQQDGKWYVLLADEPTLARPWHPFDHNLLSLSDPEILEVQAPKSIEQLSQLLQTETTKQEALTLALQLMDSNIERPDLKERIATMLAEYAQEETVAQFLENRLLSTPLPASFQPGLASNLCRAIQQQRMAALYDLLDRHADEMEAMRVAWIKIAKKGFESSEQAHAVFTFLVEEGHFAALTCALIAHDVKSWDNAISNASRALKAFGITNVAQVLSAIYSELIGHFAVHSQEATNSHMLPNHVKNFLNDIESATYDEVPNEPESMNLVQHAQAEWHFAVLSAKLYSAYQQELAEFKEKVEALSTYDDKIFTNLRSFRDKVHNQIRERNLYHQHAKELRYGFNALFEKLKEVRKFGPKAQAGSIVDRRISGFEDAMKRLEDSLRRDEEELAFQHKKGNTSENQLEAQIRGAKMKMIEERANGKRERLAELMKTRNEVLRQANTVHAEEAHIAAKKAERQQIKAKKSTIK